MRTPDDYSNNNMKALTGYVLVNELYLKIIDRVINLYIVFWFLYIEVLTLIEFHYSLKEFG